MLNVPKESFGKISRTNVMKKRKGISNAVNFPPLMSHSRVNSSIFTKSQKGSLQSVLYKCLTTLIVGSRHKRNVIFEKELLYKPNEKLVFKFSSFLKEADITD